MMDKFMKVIWGIIIALWLPIAICAVLVWVTPNEVEIGKRIAWTVMTIAILMTPLGAWICSSR